jgi:hypothetical protein
MPGFSRAKAAIILLALFVTCAFAAPDFPIAPTEGHGVLAKLRDASAAARIRTASQTGD